MSRAFIAGLFRDERQLILVLVDETGQRALPVWIEWENWWPLDDHLLDWHFPLPSNFLVMANLIRAGGGEPVEVCLHTVEGDTLYAAIRVRSGDGSRRDVDAKPNDAVTLAAVADIPIMIHPEVLASQGVAVPDSARAAWTPGALLDRDALARIVGDALQQHPFQIDPVVEGLYISGIRRRPLAETLRAMSIRHVLRLYQTEYPWPDDFVVCQNALEDGAQVSPEALRRGVDFIRDSRAAGHNVLVLCYEGMSRSSTFVLAYLVRELGYDLPGAWRQLHERHPKAWPAFQMWSSLIEQYRLPYTMDDVRRWLAADGRG